MLSGSARVSFCTLLLLITSAVPAYATDKPKEVPTKATIIERLNEKTNLDLAFTDQHGQQIHLSDLIIEGRPAIITPVYYRCPNLCSLTLNGTVKMLKELIQELELGKDFSVITVSINPREKPKLAATKAENYYKELGNVEAGRAGWHFLTGSEENIKQLMDQLGFVYAEDGKEFLHTAAIMIVSPLGKISRYLYGVEYPPPIVKYSLVEAAQGRIGSTIDRVFLYCFSYDPTKGQYTPIVMNIIRAVCFAIVGLLVLVLGTLKLKERVG